MSAKWDAYYTRPDGPPWESGTYVSQVAHALDSGLLLSGGAALEVGCGSGATTAFLARRYSRLVGLDISEEALRRARGTVPATAETTRIEWLLADLLDTPRISELHGKFDTVVDVQTFHATAGALAPAAVVAAAIASFLRTGGRLLVIAGNSREPPRLVPGPTLLTREEVVSPFEAAGLYLESLEETRFDSTPAYGLCPPLAWVAVFSRPT